MKVVPSAELIGTRKPLVSVCIANYNGEAFIAECIESVLNQIDAPDFEIIVHDDASTDGSVGIIERYPDVRLLASSGNVGFCVSNNRMAGVARGSYLLLLNNDAVLFPDALKTLAYTAAQHLEAPILSVPQYDYSSGELLDMGFRVDPFFNPVPVKATDSRELAMVMGSCLWISAELWSRVGGFPEWMHSIGEDLYLCLYARLLGYPTRVPNASGYRHRVGTSFGGGKVVSSRLASTTQRRSLSERNKTCAMFVLLPGILFWLLVPAHLLLLLVEGLTLSLLRADWRILAQIYLTALTAPWHLRRSLRAARQSAQGRRSISARSFAAAIYWFPWKLVLLLRHGLPSIR